MSEPVAVELADDAPTGTRSSTNGSHGAKPAAKTPASQTPADPDNARTQFGMTFNDQRFLGVLVVVMLTLMGWHWVQLSGWGTQPVEIDRLPAVALDDRIDINSANWVEFTQLDGIGETLAERIVADRERNGRFETVDDLKRVNGIGEKTLARIRKFLVVRPEAE